MSSPEEVIYSVEDVMRILPHRYPFMLIDKVVSFNEGTEPGSRVGSKVIAIKNVTFNEPFFPGHFPHKPIMPGVLQVEAMAQAGAIAADRKGADSQDVAIAAIKNSRFRRPVVPGDTLRIHAEITKDRGTMLSMEASIFVDGLKVSEAEVLAKVFPMKAD